MRDKFIPAQTAFVKLVAEGNKDEALVKYMFSVRSAQTKYLAALDKFVTLQHTQMEEAGAASALQAGRTGWLIAALALAATLASGVVGWLATRSITRPLTRAVEIAKKVAAGDLSSRIEVRTQDETGQLMAALSDNERQPARHRRQRAPRYQFHCRGVDADRQRQPGPVIAHRGAGGFAGADHLRDEGT